MFTRRHYQYLAKSIDQVDCMHGRNAGDIVLDWLIDILKSDNPRFDPAKFRSYSDSRRFNPKTCRFGE